MHNFITTVLQGQYIRLEPLHSSHKEPLRIAAQNPLMCEFIGTSLLGDTFNDWFDKAMRDFSLASVPFVVRRLFDNQLIGSTRYYDIALEHARLSIGYTWYVPEVWGSFVNPETKLLLLQYAFETLYVNRVQLKTDMRNARSRAAIKKLGATEEGILRQHMILEDGFVRDTVIFSIIKPEWPYIKAGLQKRLLQFSEKT